MNRILLALATIFASLVMEVVLRRVDEIEKADIAEATMIVTSVTLMEEAINSLDLNPMIKSFLANKAFLTNFAKVADNLAEEAVTKVEKVIDEKLNEQK